MYAKRWPMLVLIPLFAVAARGQESVRDLREPGEYTKFLTTSQLDRWVFEGEKGETIIAHVASQEFDPILELAKPGEKDDQVVLEVDDPGHESHFAIRLPETGQYKIRVHAYKYQGGGNYKLKVRRFQAKPLAVGKPLVGTFDREGKSYYYFTAVKDQIFIPALTGVPADAWKILDVKGREMADWAGSVHIEAGGECSVVVSGNPDGRYDLVLREARRQDLAAGKEMAGRLQQGEMDVWNLQGKPGDFRLVEVEKEGAVHSRLKYAPLDKKSEPQIRRAGERPEIVFLPVASRGGHVRFAAIFGREGRYELQLLAQTPASYKLTLRDPSVPIAAGGEVTGNLPVGGAAFYSFQATPGQLIQAGLTSEKFVPVLRLYDRDGTVAGSSGADADGLEGRLTHMVVKEGLYRLQVSSLGDGGGGEFRQTLGEIKLRELPVGGRGQGTVQPGATDFWAFAGKEGQTVFLNVRSTAFEPTVSVRSPDGVPLATNEQANAATGPLLALRLPKTGRYTIWISSRRGAGEFALRLIDGD